MGTRQVISGQIEYRSRRVQGSDLNKEALPEITQVVVAAHNEESGTAKIQKKWCGIPKPFINKKGHKQ